MTPSGMVDAALVLARHGRGKDMPPGVAVFILILVVGGLVLGWYFSHAQVTTRAMRRAQHWKIAELPDSTVGRIVGRATPIGETMTSPLRGKPCVYYAISVRTRGKGSHEIAREERFVPFAVEDESGRAIIDPLDANVVLDIDHSPPQEMPVDPAFAQRHAAAIGAKSVFYLEEVLEVGEAVAVVGAGVREPDPDGRAGDGYRDAPAMRLRLASSKQLKLQISDYKTTITSRDTRS